MKSENISKHSSAHTAQCKDIGITLTTEPVSNHQNKTASLLLQLLHVYRKQQILNWIGSLKRVFSALLVAIPWLSLIPQHYAEMISLKDV